MCPAPREDNRSSPQHNNHQASSSSSDEEVAGENGTSSYEQLGYALMQTNDEVDASSGGYISSLPQNGTSLFDNDSGGEDELAELPDNRRNNGTDTHSGNGHQNGITAGSSNSATTEDSLIRDFERMTQSELGSRGGGGVAANSELWAPTRDMTQVDLWNSSSTEPEVKPEPVMTTEEVDTIKSIMSRFSLPDSAVPNWAKTVPENEWTALLKNRCDQSTTAAAAAAAATRSDVAAASLSMSTTTTVGSATAAGVSNRVTETNNGQ